MDSPRILADALRQKDEKGIIALAVIQDKNMIQTRNTLAILRYFQAVTCKNPIASEFMNTVTDDLLQCVDHPVADTVFGLAGTILKVQELRDKVQHLNSLNVVKEEKYIDVGVQWTGIMNEVRAGTIKHDAARQAEQKL